MPGIQTCSDTWRLIALHFAPRQVIRNPGFPRPTAVYVVFGSLMVMTASAGLVLLYLVTTTDPGCIPRGAGQDPAQKPHEKAKAGSARERYSNYRQGLCRCTCNLTLRVTVSTPTASCYRAGQFPACLAGSSTRQHFGPAIGASCA